MRPLNFMIVGAQKSGTTALAEFLGEHPDIEMASPKEVHVFDNLECFCAENRATVDQRYEQAFGNKDVVSCLTGEATPIYLFFTDIASSLAEYNPDLKLIVLLRDPVQRAYSHHQMESRRQAERWPFWLALMLEPFRLMLDRHPRRDGSSHRIHSYRSRGLYARQLAAIYRVFPPEQVLILYNEDLRHDHEQTLARVFRFLNVSLHRVEPRTVFAQGVTLNPRGLTGRLLKQSFQREYRRLRQSYGVNTATWRDAEVGNSPNNQTFTIGSG